MNRFRPDKPVMIWAPSWPTPQMMVDGWKIYRLGGRHEKVWLGMVEAAPTRKDADSVAVPLHHATPDMRLALDKVHMHGADPLAIYLAAIGAA